MKQEIETGWVMVHRATGERGVVVAVDGERCSLSRGLDKFEVVDVPVAALRREDPTSPPAPAPATDDAKTIQVEIGGQRFAGVVLRRQGPGLVVTGGGGMHLALESHALDAEHFRRVFASLDDQRC